MSRIERCFARARAGAFEKRIQARTKQRRHRNYRRRERRNVAARGEDDAESCRPPAGAALPLHPGVALLYDQLKAPVVPTALNSGVFWGRRTFIKKPGTVIIEFLPPMPEGMKKKDFLIELHARLNTASDRLMAEAGADVVALRAALQEKPST